jgi:Trypsin-co-occurring domain 1
MNDADELPEVVSARLPSGILVKLELSSSNVADGMTSVGLRDLNLNDALDTVGEIGAMLVEKLQTAKPSKATAELKFGFSVESGKLIALWVNGKGEASLTVTLEWSGQHDAVKGGHD